MCSTHIPSKPPLSVKEHDIEKGLPESQDWHNTSYPRIRHHVREKGVVGVFLLVLFWGGSVVFGFLFWFCLLWWGFFGGVLFCFLRRMANLFKSIDGCDISL